MVIIRKGDQMEAKVTVDWKKVGEGLMDGAFNSVGKFVMLYLLVVFALWLFGGISGVTTDDTDASSWHRSGFRIMTDARTGLQYLSDGKGGLILRVDAAGKPITGK